MSPRLPRASALSFKLSRHAAACALAMLGASALAPAVAAVPSLGFSSYAGVYGYLNTQYSSALMGDVSFSINGTGDWKYNVSTSALAPTGLASATYEVVAGSVTTDPVYNIVTNDGRFGFSYSGQAEVTAFGQAPLSLHTQMTSSTVDTNPALGTSANTYQYSYSQAQFNVGYYIAPTASRAAGSYGAIVVGVTLDGSFPSLADPSIGNDAGAYLNATSSFSDTAGVSYNSSFSVSASAYDTSWTGQKTVFKKLLFQYGTPFEIRLYQYVSAGNNGSADFFNTGKISQIELPYGAVLESGAQQAGLGDASSLYGQVFNSATVDAQNTNWDFGNNGGGFTPNVPEPQTWALMLAGLLAIGKVARRRAAG